MTMTVQSYLELDKPMWGYEGVLREYFLSHSFDCELHGTPLLIAQGYDIDMEISLTQECLDAHQGLPHTIPFTYFLEKPQIDCSTRRVIVVFCPTCEDELKSRLRENVDES